MLGLPGNRAPLRLAPKQSRCELFLHLAQLGTDSPVSIDMASLMLVEKEASESTGTGADRSTPSGIAA